ncbi:Flavin-dependent thymidylate synthase [Candidatus Hydrogenisulfobacillus filiaventi]|uniref:FAD-dependent thymidylate synthase n=1 Tax=Candidatus Hydrogenisulfobacillus filiaventi TaxID=2707344 RepID=A0A6F8ZHV5_9FIRM|nr:FAD-dependent thymidylate synthase [Bacillota bacterium]CAB1129041.1 Flavin-dependent thymidylate synthase [Candidatus Hydrogenisulfobacillus filiaventi]
MEEARLMRRVLDHGYVILHEVLGSDLTVVNAARVSYNRRKQTLEEEDVRLLRYMATHEHRSPFYHPKLQFEVKAPLVVARQWWRHVVDSVHTVEETAWNELSRRYVSEEPEFYRPGPEAWRRPHPRNKQAAAGPLGAEAGAYWSRELDAAIEDGIRRYRAALEAGIAPEQARLFLPAYGLYTSWYWTASLWSVWHFCALREGEDAQGEIREYARAVRELAEAAFPESFRVLSEAGLR